MLNMLRKLHGEFYERKLPWKRAYELKKRIQLSDKDTLLFIMTPVHGNIGDLAIAKATKVMLSEMNIEYIEATSDDLMRLKKLHSLGVLNNRRILVHGGGYLGTLWPELDELFRTIVKSIPESKVLCLPNTIFYDDNAEGQKLLKESAEVYNNHKHLRICAREKISYNLVSNIYNNVILMPDMVLSLDESKEEKPRSGCVICFRNDVEKTLERDEINQCIKETEKIFNKKVKLADINKLTFVPIEKRDLAIKETIEEFKSAELVVTDRLHGMIFCAITGTPCIVLNSKSHKIEGSYEWIKHLDYIVLAKKEDSITDLFDRIPKRRFYYNNKNLQPYYTELRKYISEIAG